MNPYSIKSNALGFFYICFLLECTVAFVPLVRKNPSTLSAKPKKKSIADDNTTEIPQNLKRKVKASRPALGHIVPKSLRKSQGGSSGPTLRSQGKLRADGINNPSFLKILGGVARGKRLDSPEVYLRPMMGKVKEAVYSTFTTFGLYEEGVSTRHLDIFCGSGSVGLESLSRGAQHCTFVDLAQNCCDTTTRNIQNCKFDDDVTTTVICTDCYSALNEPYSVGIPEGFTYNVITLCPPYEEIIYADLLEAVANSPVVTDDTVILVEYPVELGCMPHVISRKDGGALVGVRNRKYGRTIIAIYVCNPTGRLNESAQSRPEEFVYL